MSKPRIIGVAISSFLTLVFTFATVAACTESVGTNLGGTVAAGAGVFTVGCLATAFVALAD